MPPKPATPPREGGHAHRTSHAFMYRGYSPKAATAPGNRKRPSNPPSLQRTDRPPEPATPSGAQGHAPQTCHTFRRPRTRPLNPPSLKGAEETTSKPAIPSGDRVHAPQTRHVFRGPRTRPQHATPPGDRGHALRNRHASRGPRTRPPNPLLLQVTEDTPPKPATPLKPATPPGDRGHAPRSRHASRVPRRRLPTPPRL